MYSNPYRPAPLERQHRAEQDGAVAPQDDRELANVEQRRHRIRQQRRVVVDRLRIHNFRRRIARCRGPRQARIAVATCLTTCLHICLSDAGSDGSRSFTYAAMTGSSWPGSMALPGGTHAAGSPRKRRPPPLSTRCGRPRATLPPGWPASRSASTRQRPEPRTPPSAQPCEAGPTADRQRRAGYGISEAECSASRHAITPRPQ